MGALNVYAFWYVKLSGKVKKKDPLKQCFSLNSTATSMMEASYFYWNETVLHKNSL